MSSEGRTGWLGSHAAQTTLHRAPPLQRTHGPAPHVTNSFLRARVRILMQAARSA